MLLAIQFPFADCRGFVDSDTHHLSSPVWPLPEPGREFIRASGVIRHRRKGGLDGWSGEEVYCSAKNALRFNALSGRQPTKLPGTPLLFSCVFRRFLSDGREIGLNIRKSEDDQTTLHEQGCFAFIDACLSIPVRIHSENNNFLFSELLNSNKLLAKHYLRSTTKMIEGACPHTPDWWLSPGLPLLLIEYAGYEIHRLPKKCSQIEARPFLEDGIHYLRIEKAGKRFGVWFIRRDIGDIDHVRRIRMHLFRLHAERECLKQVLRLLAQSKLDLKARTPLSDSLQEYLRDSLRLMTREKSHGFSQSQIIEAVQMFDNIVNPGERDTLLSQLKKIDIRPNIYHRVEEFTLHKADAVGDLHIINNGALYIGKEQNIGGNSMTSYNINFGDNNKIVGDFVVANTIQNSFNKISSSDASTELKTRLKELTEKIAEMSGHMLQDKARQAARDLESLTEEALSEEPRKEWYELSAKGLIDAAETVTQFIIPVSGAVKAVLDLLR